LAQGIKKGWLAQDAAKATPLAAAYSNGKSAYGLAPGSDTPRYFFQRDPDGWKVNLTSYHLAARTLLEHLAEESKSKPEDLLRERLREFSQRPVDDRIFYGPLDAVPATK
jgi:hypothetical protein